MKEHIDTLSEVLETLAVARLGAAYHAPHGSALERLCELDVRVRAVRAYLIDTQPVSHEPTQQEREALNKSLQRSGRFLDESAPPEQVQRMLCEREAE